MSTCERRPAADYYAASCSSDWNDMVGDERVRRCAACGLRVYRFDGLGIEARSDLVASYEGLTGQRFFRRADGTYLTRNCPVGLDRLRARLRRVAG